MFTAVKSAHNYDSSDDERKQKTFVLMRRFFWLHPMLILSISLVLTFGLFRSYYDDVSRIPPLHHIAWILPFPYTLVCLIGLVLPYDDPSNETQRIRHFKRFIIVVVTKGSNKEAVYRGWNSMKHLRDPEKGIFLYVLTDEPHFFPDLACITVPRTFTTRLARYKARALEYFRIKMAFDGDDWILHLDEESLIDQSSLHSCINFIEKTKYSFGQGIILYNQHEYWSRPLMTISDAIRVGDDVGRFHFQYKIIHSPIFGAHGSFLLTNGALENEVTWEIGGMTEDFEFALKSWQKGHKCGEILGFVREQSPASVLDFLKQRRRWFVGILSVDHPLARYLIFQWICGVICGLVTTLNIMLHSLKMIRSPYWVGLLGNFSWVVFVYLYVLGIVIQDYDLGIRWPRIFMHSILTVVLQPIASAFECCAVLYGILWPPTVFEVIKK